MINSTATSGDPAEVARSPVEKKWEGTPCSFVARERKRCWHSCCYAGSAEGLRSPLPLRSERSFAIGAVVDQTGGSTSPHYRAAIELAGRQMNEALAQRPARSGSRFPSVIRKAIRRSRSRRRCG